MRLIIIGLLLSSCGSPEVKVDKIEYDHHEKNIDKSTDKSTNTINNINPIQEPEEEPEVIEEVQEEYDMSFDMEFEFLWGPPEHFKTEYRLRISNYNKEMTRGFRINLSYDLVEGTELEIRNYYDLGLLGDCDDYGMPKLTWIDVYAVDLDGNEYKQRYEVPFEHTYCFYE